MEIIKPKLTKKGYIIMVNNKTIKKEINGKKTKYFTKEETLKYIKFRMGL